MPLPTNPEVVVVGAGAAGLAATRRLADAGRDVLLLEAAHRIGGRCATDTETFGVPFDLGGSWLHGATGNPLTAEAEARGFTLIKGGYRREPIYQDGVLLPDSEAVTFQARLLEVWELIDAEGHAGRDLPAADAIPDDRWRRAMGHWVSWMFGTEPDRVSTLDCARYQTFDGNWVPAEGFGALIARVAGELPLRLATPVTAIDWSGPGTRIETAAGTLQADQVIVTVSTGVLAAGGIRFTPSLPTDVAQAIDDLPCGLFNKVALLVDPPLTDEAHGERYNYFPRPGEGGGFWPSYAATGLAQLFVGGDFAADLERAGPGALSDFARQAVADLYGHDAARAVRKTMETRWLANPLTRGSYSHALPGRADSRAVLRRPIADRLHFAGEACLPDWYSTVTGAHLSGLEAAERVLQSPP